MSSIIDLASTRALRHARYYKEQADDVRAKAQLMRNREVRAAMLRLAAVWDSLAQGARRKAPSTPRRSASSGRTLRASTVLKSYMVLHISKTLVEPLALIIA